MEGKKPRRTGGTKFKLDMTEEGDQGTRHPPNRKRTRHLLIVNKISLSLSPSSSFYSAQKFTHEGVLKLDTWSFSLPINNEWCSFQDGKDFTVVDSFIINNRQRYVDFSDCVC